jgi:uncharacterized membrane protein
MMDWNGHMSSGGWIFSILAMIIILALIAATIVWIARELSNRRNRGPGTLMSARKVLDHRLASGEITTEQYEQLRQTLGARPDPPAKAPPARPVDAPG